MSTGSKTGASSPGSRFTPSGESAGHNASPAPDPAPAMTGSLLLPEAGISGILSFIEGFTSAENPSGCALAGTLFLRPDMESGGTPVRPSTNFLLFPDGSNTVFSTASPLSPAMKGETTFFLLFRMSGPCSAAMSASGEPGPGSRFTPSGESAGHNASPVPETAPAMTEVGSCRKRAFQAYFSLKVI